MPYGLPAIVTEFAARINRGAGMTHDAIVGSCCHSRVNGNPGPQASSLPFLMPAPELAEGRGHDNREKTS
jgi:hypothetical protein